MTNAAALNERCWNRIGVWGRELPRCVELEKVAHCMNCRVYKTAASNALNRAVPMELREEWQLRLAQDSPLPPKKDLAILILRIGSEWLALSAVLLNEIFECSAIRRIPHAKDSAILGLAAVHGQLQLCVSLAELLDIDARPANELGLAHPVRRVVRRMVAITLAGRSYVCPCDEIAGIQRVNSQLLGEADGAPRGVGFVARQIEWEHRLLTYVDETVLTSALRLRGLQ